MRISAIQGYSSGNFAIKKNKTQNPLSHSSSRPTLNDTVSFKKNEMIKGAGIGALIGLGALALISGGAAAPVAYGVYAAVNGVAGGMLGKAIEEVNKDNAENKT